MKYAVELYFDKETENKLMYLSQRLADEKLSTKFLEWKTRPHLTLACFNDVDENKFQNQLKEFASKHKVMPAYIASVGMFNDTRTIFASPVMNKKMFQFQAELHEFKKTSGEFVEIGLVKITSPVNEIYTIELCR